MQPHSTSLAVYATPDDIANKLPQPNARSSRGSRGGRAHAVSCTAP